MIFDRVFAFLSTVVFTWIISSMIHVVLIEDVSLYKNYHLFIIPFELVSCVLFYTIVSNMATSSNIVVKSIGYGIAVAPIIAFSEFNS